MKRALDMGYTMNERGFHKLINGNKTEKLDRYFPEQSVEFLGMEYKTPMRLTEMLNFDQKAKNG